MSLTSFVQLRRMSLVRHALRRESRDGVSAAEVARRYGFRDARRFATNYRAAFGETPSATLRGALSP
jgi:AraC family transcriptional regulator, ethanolamine operon transcriptional activator